MVIEDNEGVSYLEEPPPVIPSPDAPLQDDNLPGEDPVPLLLQVEVVGVLQEHLGPAELVVRLAQHRLTDAVRGGATLHLGKRQTWC